MPNTQFSTYDFYVAFKNCANYFQNGKYNFQNFHFHTRIKVNARVTYPPLSKNRPFMAHTMSFSDKLHTSNTKTPTM